MRAELEQVYRQHRQALFSLALTITGCTGLAEDAVQEAFVRSLALCRKGRPADWWRMYSPQCGTRPWIVAVVQIATGLSQKLCLPMQRRLEAVPSTAQMTILLSDCGAGNPFAGGRFLEIIVMKIFGELTFDEIGSVLDTPAATVATRYRRTLMTLEERLRQIP